MHLNAVCTAWCLLLQLPKAPVQTTTVSSSTHAGGKKVNLYVGNLTWVNIR